MLDYLGIFKELNKRKIKYIVVGGMAINLHGIPRMTYDLDFILLLENKNIKKFITLMKKWGFKPKVPVDIMDFSNENKRNDWIKNKNMKAFNLVNHDWGIAEIDIIIDSPVNYEKAYRNIKYISLQNIQIPTIGINDLIKMKHKTGRKQDLADVKTLMKLKRWNLRLTDSNIT